MRFRGPCRVDRWDNGTTTHKKEEDRREERKKIKSRIPDANSTCQLGYSRSISSGGHMTTALTALTVKISRTKGLGGKAIVYIFPQGFNYLIVA